LNKIPCQNIDLTILYLLLKLRNKLHILGQLFAQFPLMIAASIRQFVVWFVVASAHIKQKLASQIQISLIASIIVSFFFLCSYLTVLAEALYCTI